jgi:hypothetical protein
MANNSLRAFLVLLVAMAASAVKGRPGPGPTALDPIAACCYYHLECCP